MDTLDITLLLEDKDTDIEDILYYETLLKKAIDKGNKIADKIILRRLNL